MKLITRQRLASEVAARWKRIYYRSEKWPSIFTSTVYDKLIALGPRPSPNAVKEIVGKGFVDLGCTLCDQDVEEIVLCDKVSICRACAEQIVGVFADGEGDGDES